MRLLERIEPLRRGGDAQGDPVERGAGDRVRDRARGGVSLRERALAVEAGGLDEPRHFRVGEPRPGGRGFGLGRIFQPAERMRRQGAERGGVDRGRRRGFDDGRSGNRMGAQRDEADADAQGESGDHGGDGPKRRETGRVCHSDLRRQAKARAFMKP